MDENPTIALPHTPAHDGPAQSHQMRRPGSLRRTLARESFHAPTSITQRKKSDASLRALWVGIAVTQLEGHRVAIGLASHDGTYSIDISKHTLVIDIPTAEDRGDKLARFLVDKFDHYRQEHLFKFVGAGMTQKVVALAPALPSLLWRELDIVPVVFPNDSARSSYPPRVRRNSGLVDEEADSMARKCVEKFGPTLQPRLQVGIHHMVEVDLGGQAEITRFGDYALTVGERTWEATAKCIRSLKERNIRIAFFNSTPQGGGVALMRHALVRFFRLAEVDVRWYVPRPKPDAFRITKNNHNILQGVAEKDLRLAQDQAKSLDEWAESNANTFWVSPDQPLASPEEGGAHVVIVDDPQMPSLVKIAKEIAPNRPVIFRSHIQVRADLADQEGTPTSEVWNWIWENVKDADLFISHPVRGFVPSNVTFPKVGYMPATTDWLDGLNKNMSNWDSQYYMDVFDVECFKQRMNKLAYPDREYIVQIARFDPAKGIPVVLASYAKFRRSYLKGHERKAIPQVVIAGHGAIDDPDATLIYDQTIADIAENYEDIKEDIIVMRLGPTDQVLNVLMSCAYVALQLSTREGFEVKVSEALHKGTPIIATKAGGIPLQVEHGKSGYLVEPGNHEEVAMYLHKLFTDTEAYEKMSRYAEDNVSDEVSTVGNALCWLYLADELSNNKTLLPDSKWINDMAREEAKQLYEDKEARLPRLKKLELNTSQEPEH
ncbi:trehalose synthase (Ccg-9) [Polyplosphaeria fusca]|uniref:Trehalose synthase (Ccg-9) n=1 Tax=Polyplosphaeria fusca TaxID=682080 RepID=A0A9P4QZ09_9PLEO|nr:trehalose synthase (Ccg-9) [Polyplosphaeria fusca]